MKKSFSFRVSQETKTKLLYIVQLHHFASVSELTRFIIIYSVHRSIFNHWKPGKICLSDDVIIGCRLTANNHRLVMESCCKRSNVTACVWGGMVVEDWLRFYYKEDSRQQKGQLYQYYLDNFARKQRELVGRLQLGLDQIPIKK